MVFSRQLPLSSLIELCRALRHNLGAGLTLLDVFRQQSRRGSLAVRHVAERISDVLARGDNLETALEGEPGLFPPMFVSLVHVGEKTGTLPEVFAELEKYFTLQQRLRRQFLTQSMWPLFQLGAAIFVIAGMLFVLGILGSDFAPLGSSMRGTAGALKFLLIAFGTIGALVGLYFLATRTLRRRQSVHSVILRLPVLGPCLQAIAMARFCMAMHLTQETSLSLPKSLRLCLRATGNAAFAAQMDVIEPALRAGEDLAEALSQSWVFPYDFVNILATAEEGGRVPEVMQQQAAHYHEEAERRLRTLTAVAGFGVWLIVALILIVMIFYIFVTAYINPINNLLK